MIQVQKYFVFLCVILCTAGLCPADQRYGYEYIKEVDAWLRLHIVPATWNDARLKCHLEGGTLASPTSPGLVSAMKSMMQTKFPTTPKIVYTGIQSVVAPGEYATIEGVPLENIALRWASGQPDNRDDSEQCLTMDGTGALADEQCSRMLRYFCLKDNDKMITTDCGTWDSEYELDARTGSCYKLSRVPRTWHRAAEACRAAGAHLAIINSPDESQVLKELLAKHPHNLDYALIGFWDWDTRGDWLTIHGQTFAEAGFGTWGKGQPNNYGGVESCGSIERSGLLNDFPCYAKNAYICEITPERDDNNF